MAQIKSLFNKGLGKVQEVAGLVYNDAAGGSLEISLPVTSTSSITAVGVDAGAGALEGASSSVVGLAAAGSLNIGAAAVAVDGFSVGLANNDKLTTKGYVDEAVAVIASGISLQDFTVASATGLAVGKIVALGSGTNAPLILADKDGDATSNAIGVIKAINSLVVTVQLDAQISVTLPVGAALGDPMFVGDAGACAKYADLGAGDFATQIGYVSDAAGKIVILPKSYGELA